MQEPLECNYLLHWHATRMQGSAPNDDHSPVADGLN